MEHGGTGGHRAGRLNQPLTTPAPPPADDRGQPEGVTSHAVAWWHTLLRAIAVLNVALWSLAAIAVAREHAIETCSACLIQLVLSAVYVSACAFRSALPVFDIARLVLVDSRLSSVLVGRSVATVAELCFAAQWALMLHAVALPGGSRFGQALSLAVVPLIGFAQGCAWHAVLTTRQRGHVVENSIWGLTAALVVAGMLLIGPQRSAALSPLMIAWCVGGAAYVAFIFGFDVPMYWSRWRADQAQGRQYLSIAQGMIDIGSRWTVSYRWHDWKNEALWMSLYFTFGVWGSISLVYATLALAGQRN